MRVIAGHLRSRRLVGPPTGVRPTPDRVREAIFSRLGDAEGVRVLDLYAGTGALGIEALSRGAAFAVFVDRAHSSLAVVRKNIDACELGASTKVVRSTALRALDRFAREGARFDWVFLDPPYDSDELLPALDALARGSLLKPGGLVVVETAKRHSLGPLEGWTLLDEREYGDTRVASLTPAAGAAREPGGAEASSPGSTGADEDR